jgi:hypothetical protein
MPAMALLLETVASKLGNPFPRDRNDRWDALLVESGRSTRDLKRIFKQQKHQYLAFLEATQPLGYDALNEQVWGLANTENRGFQETATHYARRFHPS